VDVTRRSNSAARRWPLSTVLLAALALLAADAQGPGHVDALKFEAGEGTMSAILQTSRPVPRFVCRLSAATRDVVVEFPGSTGRLMNLYDPKSPLVQTATVQTDPGGQAGVAIHFALGSGILSGVEQTEQGVLLRFDAAQSDPAERSPSRTDEYAIGPGDKLEIAVFGHDDLSKIVEVRGDGTINFPLIGDLRVVGSTPSEVDDAITRLLKKDYLVDPQVSVDVKEYQSHSVTVIGEVRSPGRYVLKRNMRLIDLLAEAGGATKEAGSEIVVTRHMDEGGRATPPISVDRDRLLSHDNLEANIALMDGDIITIGEKGAFYIRGEVSRPGSYFIEKGMTILRAISVAGGFTQFANRKEVELLRAGDKGLQVRKVINLRAIESGKREDIPLRANDTVIVARRIF
jgi:polysaccharide biosynthesis/export protein